MREIPPGSLAGKVAFVAAAARSEQPGTLPGTIGSVAAEITETGGRALPVACDVTSEASMNDVVAATISEFGGIDVLVANAGMRWLGPVETTPLKRWQLCLDVNLTGVFLVIRAVIPHIRARGGGSLIAITTTGVDMPGANAYWVSKAAGTLPACRFHPRWWNHRRPWRRPRWCWPVKTLRESPAPCSVPKNSTPEATASVRGMPPRHGVAGSRHAHSRCKVQRARCKVTREAT